MVEPSLRRSTEAGLAWDPIQVLLEESDPLQRSAAHLALGQRAMAREDLGAATHHFREAADLDPTDERPRSYLRTIEPAKPRRRRVLDFFRRR